MAKLATMTLTGVSGQKYTFGVYPFGTKFKPISAVYFITRRICYPDGIVKHEKLYVGETGDLSTRFDNHHKQAQFTDNQANCICILQTKGELNRLFIEADLIHRYDPPCNG